MKCSKTESPAARYLKCSLRKRKKSNVILLIGPGLVYTKAVAGTVQRSLDSDVCSLVGDADTH